MNANEFYFPVTQDTNGGVSVRDHIAIQMAAAIAPELPSRHTAEVAVRAYKLADALIAESKKEVQS